MSQQEEDAIVARIVRERTATKHKRALLENELRAGGKP